LAVFERKILRKIYGPVEGNELRRIRWNDELEDIIKGENIVRLEIRWSRISYTQRTEGSLTVLDISWIGTAFLTSYWWEDRSMMRKKM
jgi:hypothetical protein